MSLSKRYSMHEKDYTEIFCSVKQTTGLAVLITVENAMGFPEKHWVPRSVIREGQDLSDDEMDAGVLNGINLEIETWFVEKEGIDC